MFAHAKQVEAVNDNNRFFYFFVVFIVPLYHEGICAENLHAVLSNVFFFIRFGFAYVDVTHTHAHTHTLSVSLPSKKVLTGKFLPSF